jgi:hypothetical protein
MTKCYVAIALRGRSSSRGAVFAAIATGLALSACGGATQQPARVKVTSYPVVVSTPGFPAAQRLAQRSRLVIFVRNVGTGTIPNIAVTITNPRYGTAAQPFSTLIAPQPGLASRSRPVWIVDRPPGVCTFACLQGGPGGAATAYSNTWALGRLKPGQTARFAWALTAVRPGRYAVAYRFTAALDGSGRAVRPGGLPAAGLFRVTIVRQPRTAYVQNNGQVVYSR